MANGKSLESRKSRLNEVGSKIEEKSTRLSQLESAKVAAREARQQIEGLDLDDEAKNQAIAETNEAYESVSNEAKEVSDKIGDDLKELEELRQETSTSLEAAEQAKNAEDNLVSACAENGIIVPREKGLDSNISGNQELLNEIIEKMQKAETISTRLDTL